VLSLEGSSTIAALDLQRLKDHVNGFSSTKLALCLVYRIFNKGFKMGILLLEEALKALCTDNAELTTRCLC